VLGSKIELRLKKSEPIQWSDLGADARKAVAVVQPANFSNLDMQRPVYPSSKVGAVQVEPVLTVLGFSSCYYTQT